MVLARAVGSIDKVSGMSDPDEFPMCYPDLEPDEDGLVGVGGRMTPTLVLDMLTRGVFPWTGKDPIPWFSPDPRLILEPTAFKRSRSFRKTLRRGGFEVSFDRAFADVMAACAETARPGQDGTWITPNMVETFAELHEIGAAHSVEVTVDGELVGGLYGLSLGRAFFGESMFQRRSDMSKVALSALCDALEQREFLFIDCQQETDHLMSLGAYAIPRLDYLRRLDEALDFPTWVGPWVSGPADGDGSGSG